MIASKNLVLLFKRHIRYFKLSSVDISFLSNVSEENILKVIKRRSVSKEVIKKIRTICTFLEWIEFSHRKGPKNISVVQVSLSNRWILRKNLFDIWEDGGGE